MPTREEIVAAFPLQKELEREGIKLEKSGANWMALCCFHNEKTPSLSVNLEKGTFYCFGCNAAGGVIDFLARRWNKSIGDVLRELGQRLERYGDTTPGLGTPTATYIYRDAGGNPIFRVLRYPPSPQKPKDFRQQRYDAETKEWIWGMEGVERTIYRLPEVLANKNAPVWIVEGEKDADNVSRFGFNATTNVGGAGKWVNAYSDILKDRDVIISGDNDETGRKHVKSVTESLDGKCRSLRVITIPAPAKDVSDFLSSYGSLETGAAALEELVNRAPVIVQGATIPVYSMVEMEEIYKKTLDAINGRTYRFGSWLPTLDRNLRPCVPGDVVTWAAGTGVGKTAILQNMAINAAPLPVLLFEMELSDSVTFERFVASVMSQDQKDIEAQYRAKMIPNWREDGRLSSVFTCPMSGLNVPTMEKIVDRAEIKIGVRPVLVMIDYAQLLTSARPGASRYDTMTENMTLIKTMAKNSGVIVVIASQIQRPDKSKEGNKKEVGLNSAKESGQIENSSSLHLGAWMEGESETDMIIQVNKNTRGRRGLKVKCRFDGATMGIREATPEEIEQKEPFIPPPDIPESTPRPDYEPERTEYSMPEGS